MFWRVMISLVMLSCSKQQMIENQKDFGEMLHTGVGYVLNGGITRIYEFDIDHQKGYVFDFATSLKCEYPLHLYYENEKRVVEWMSERYELVSYQDDQYFRLKKADEYFDFEVYKN